MSIVIFGDSFSFPDGGAPANRVHTYAKGFHENGIAPHVICFKNQYTENISGLEGGIRYYYPFGQKKRSRYFIVRRWHKIIKFIKAFRLINKINNNDKILACICDSEVLLTQLSAFFASRWVKTIIILERSEHPLRYFQGSLLRKLTGRLKIRLETVFCDGIFCISYYLLNFYKEKGLKPERLFLVPSTVDTERFNITSDPPFGFEYSLYCGRLNLKKDGVDILIKSFAGISDKYSSLNLVLLGGEDNPQDGVVLKNLVRELNIGEKVLFLGNMSRSEIPVYLNNAKILALSRPTSIIADAGFPSKLTEYLASGRPVLVTSVGEIPLYLTDNENVFICEPDSVEAFSDRLSFILENYEFAEKVAEKGKMLTRTTFNYNYQAARIILFLNSL